MDDRDKNVLSLRSAALGNIHPQSSAEEVFQNRTLRPVLQVQNDLFIECFLNYANKYKGDFYNLSLEKKFAFIDNAIHKDIEFRNVLKGMIIGMFSIDEYREYSLNTSRLNKRMMNMLIERLKDQVQLLVQNKIEGF